MITTLREGKAKLSALVELASRGEEVIITVRGKPKARLCPVVKPLGHARRGRDAWIQGLREARAQYSVGVRDSGAAILDETRGERT